MELSVRIRPRDLFEFSMYNASRGMTGIMNIILTVGPLILLAASFGWTSVMQKILLMSITVIFAFVQPVMLYRKAVRQAERGFKDPLGLDFSDEKITVRYMDDTANLNWDMIWNVIDLAGVYVITTGPTRGYVIPKRDLDEDEDKEMTGYFKRNIPARKLKGFAK